MVADGVIDNDRVIIDLVIEPLSLLSAPGFPVSPTCVPNTVCSFLTCSISSLKAPSLALKDINTATIVVPSRLPNLVWIVFLLSFGVLMWFSGW